LFKASTQRTRPYPVPDFLFAAKSSKRSQRPLETVTPLAIKLKLRVNDLYDDQDFSLLAKELTTNPRYSGKTVLICWRQENLPDLAKALGATNSPDNWKGEVFDRIWQINFDKEGRATFADLPQQLLPTDTSE